MKLFPFTPIQERYIRRYNNHFTAKELAKKFDCEVYQVQNYRQSKRLLKPSLTEDQKRTIDTLYDVLTDREIAERIGVNHKKVSRYRWAMKLSKRGKMIDGYFDVNAKNWAV